MLHLYFIRVKPGFTCHLETRIQTIPGIERCEQVRVKGICSVWDNAKWKRPSAEHTMLIVLCSVRSVEQLEAVITAARMFDGIYSSEKFDVTSCG